MANASQDVPLLGSSYKGVQSRYIGDIDLEAGKKFQKEVLGFAEKDCDGQPGPGTRMAMTKKGIDIDALGRIIYPGEGSALNTLYYSDESEGRQSWAPARRPSGTNDEIPTIDGTNAYAPPLKED